MSAAPADDPSATFSGGPGTATVSGTLYARVGAALTLTVTTPSNTVCVDVDGAFSGHQQSGTAKTTWTFTTTAGTGDGAQSVTVAASPGFNSQKCTGQTRTNQASFVLDNTAPVVTGAVSPAANAAGWHNSNVGIQWSATDAGSGLASGPTPATDSVNGTTSGTTKTSTATDRVGNTGTGQLSVKLDKGAPNIVGSRTPAANTNGWNNTDVTVSFSCTDSVSGVKGCSGPTTLSSNGAGQSVTGQGADNADNTATVTVGNINIDKVAPTLGGAATTPPNANGWYNTDVTVRWTASDALSGIAGGTPADSTITGQGTNLTATASVSDKAGNTASATSNPVKIDRTAPSTAISGASNAWTNGDVTVTLTPSDALSGVASTTYAVDGGSPQTGTTLTLSEEGDHTVTFFSTDKAGNAEAVRTAHVRIDKTAPSIGHAFDLAGYLDGAWTNQDVSVTFTCTDQGGSGVASCTGDETVTAEGGNHKVVGTARDNAGNTATDTATVSIDKTPPTIDGSADRAPNGNGWYNDDVTIGFTAHDALSGLASATGDKVLDGEGAGQHATGTAVDAAGNTASHTVGGINIDKTAPVLTGTYAAGWHRDDVTVHWSCTDALSGVAEAPEDEVLTGEGDNLSSTATCTDKAGNTGTKTVAGIKVDRHPPTTTAEVPEPLDSGWYGGPVEVTLTGHDNLSGVVQTLYSVDGGEPQEYAGTFTFGTKGKHTIRYWSVDGAGNVEDGSANVLDLKIDGNPPTTTVINPISPASGWFVTNGIPVAFEAVDAESGITATYYSLDGGETRTYGVPFTEELGDGPHTLTYWSVDLAGNVEEKQVTRFSIDATAPTIGHQLDATANGNGWFDRDVTVTFQCADSGSGIDTCLADGTDASFRTVGEGKGQSVSGTATDNAGNTATDKVEGINVDTTRPVLNVDGALSGAYPFGSVPAAPTCTASDALSGLDGSCTVSGYGTGVGTHDYTVTARDRAGNVAVVAGRYTVKAWTLKGFYAPVDMNNVWNTVKNGSTVPLKFQVFGAQELTSTAAIGATFAAKPVTCPSGSFTADPIEVLSTGGTSLRYDSTAGQFIQNWQTPKKAGACYAVTVTTADGSTQTANFQLK